MFRSTVGRALLTCVVTLVAALFIVTAAQAANFHVDSTTDAPDASINGVCDDGTGHCTRRAAIDEANNSSEADTITMDAGRYTITRAGASEDFNSTGDFDIAPNGALTIVGASSDPRDTVISANGEDRVFQVIDGGQLTLQNLSVTDGHADSSEDNGFGGGILLGGQSQQVENLKTRQDNLATQLHLDNTKVVNNVADSIGGGVADDASGCSEITLENNSHVDRNTGGDLGGGIVACGELTTTDSTIDGNSSTSGDGGGLAFEGAEVNQTDTSVSNNRSYQGNGGGIYDGGNSLTIHGGQVNDNVARGRQSEVGNGGGGIYVDSGTLDITGTDITDNATQTSNGGGIYYDGDDDVNITDATIHSNNAENGRGGGIYNGLGNFTIAGTDVTSNSAGAGGGGIWSIDGDVTISGSTIDDNGDHQVPVDSGGGIWGENGDLTIDGSSVSGNSTRLNGGGIWWTDGDVKVRDSSVDHNFADVGEGGGLWAGSAVVEVTRSSTSHNHSGDIGGGIYVGVAQSLTVTDSDVNDNNADGDGGGIWNDAALTVSGTSISRNVSTSRGGGLFNSSTNTATISDTTISGNHSDLLQDDSGGGIYEVNPSNENLKVVDGNDLDLINVTIAENESDYGEGGGIFAQDSSVGLTNVLLANSTVTGAENNCASSGGSFNSGGHNLATDDGTDCGLTGAGEVLNASPKLGAIQNNSGPSETQALGDGSDAIDKGDDSVCSADPVNSVDQRGFARPFGAACDIGAYETGLADVAVISNVDNVDPVGAGGNVTYTIRVRNIGPSPDTATGVVLHNAIPAGTTFVSASSSQGSCSPTACSLGSLPLGATATVAVTVKTGSPGVITDTANVTATTSDPDHTNDSASQNTTVVAGQSVVAPSQQTCTPSPPRTSISRNGLDAKRTTVKLVGRTIDFRCAGQNALGGIKRVRVAVALRVGKECRFLKHNGKLTSSRSCSKRAYFRARLGHIRNGKVPWTFRKRHLDLPTGRYIAVALGTDSQNNDETTTRRFNLKHFRIR
jgi:uncharacterized repeat protein (TIGR01451 family)